MRERTRACVWGCRLAVACDLRAVSNAVATRGSERGLWLQMSVRLRSAKSEAEAQLHTGEPVAACPAAIPLLLDTISLPCCALLSRWAPLQWFNDVKVQ